MLLTEYDYETDIEVQREEALQEGIEKGASVKAIEDARNFKQLGVSIELIAKATGLSIEQIESL